MKEWHGRGLERQQKLEENFTEHNNMKKKCNSLQQNWSACITIKKIEFDTKC